jgi:hypothetical protein
MTDAAAGNGEDSLRRLALRHLLVLLGLTGFALSQPMLSLLGDSPILFSTHNVEGAALVVVVVGLTFLPPLVLWGLELAVSAVNRRAGAVTHLVIVAALAILALIQVVKALGLEQGVLIGLVAGGIGVGLTVAYARFAPVATWLQYTAVLPFLALALFFTSPSASLIDRSDTDPVETASSDALDNVVFIVLDEFPTKSLLDDTDGIDPVRFPHLAELAGDATWYRNYTAAAPSTRFAVPAILSGNQPLPEAPLLANYPDNLFTWLAPTHDLTAFETATQLCGLTSCAEGPPGSGSGGDVQLADLLSTTADLYRERVSLGPNKGERIDTFEETVEIASAPPNSSLSAGSDAPDVLTDAELQARPGRLNDYIDSLVPRPGRPALFFLHIMLPHSPWRLDAEGNAYGTGFGLPDTYPFTGQNNDGEWISAVTEQRHLLQAQYTDALVGDIMAELRERGLYDDSLVVVLGDHGASFELDTPMRALPDGDQNLDALAFAPLLIKAPGQTEGAIDDSNLMAIDVLPTVADLLGLELDFEVEGLPAGDPGIDARGSEKVFYDTEGGAGAGTIVGVRTFDGDDHQPRAADRWIPPLVAGAPTFAGLYERFGLEDQAALIGTSIDDLDLRDAGRARMPMLDRIEWSPKGTPRVGLAGGSVEGTSGDAIVLAVNGTIVAVSPLYEADGQPGSFAFLFPNDALNEGTNEVRLAVLDGQTASEPSVER